MHKKVAICLFASCYIKKKKILSQLSWIAVFFVVDMNYAFLKLMFMRKSVPIYKTIEM